MTGRRLHIWGSCPARGLFFLRSRSARLLLILVWILTSCRDISHKDPREERSHDPGTSVPLDTADATEAHPYAHGFRIRHCRDYKLLEVFNNLAGRTDTLQYLLVQRGHPVPAGYPNAQVIPIPVKSIVCMSSTHVAQACFAGVADRITGLGSLQYLYDPTVRQNSKDGKIKQVGLDGNLNNELILTLHPDVLIVMGNPDIGFGKYKTLTEAGIPVLLNTDWLETSPLGRAEWVKPMAALVNREAPVDLKFDSLVRAYRELVQLAGHASTRPRVIVGIPYKGSWFVPAGESYMAQFLRDAGASYKWSDSKGTGSLALDFESVAPEALTADFWLNTDNEDSKSSILAKDNRFGSFQPFKTNRIYNNTNRLNELGCNDYWESGETHPQWILADLIHILHPELMPDHPLLYYKKIN